MRTQEELEQQVSGLKEYVAECETACGGPPGLLICKIETLVGELAHQMQKAYMRNDLESADRIAVLIGEKKPSDHEKEAL